MIQAVFISDVHLHPNDAALMQRFDAWLDWAMTNVRSVYILGDFFHVWAGDDTVDAWSGRVADRLARFTDHGIAVYFLPGNRDFLIGKRFMQRAKMTPLVEPFLLSFGETRVLLTHGDGYCRDDKLHQWFRWLTRNRWFVRLFLSVPRRLRLMLVQGVRKRSMRWVEPSRCDVVVSSLLDEAARYDADVVIHGHTHRPMMKEHARAGRQVRHVVLSDWDSTPSILCYNEHMGFYWYV